MLGRFEGIETRVGGGGVGVRLGKLGMDLWHRAVGRKGL